MRVLIGCEFSGVVRRAFRMRGHDAWSCDLLPSDDNSPYHIQGDVLSALENGWELGIFHPPCTWLCQAMRTNAARKDRPNITPIFEMERTKAFNFVLSLWNCPIPHVSIENPIGYLNSWKKPSQIIRPFMFGHPYNKDICLWNRGLPNLTPTNALPPPYKKLDFWSNKRNPNGRSLKSITFPGIAEAMAMQWGLPSTTP